MLNFKFYIFLFKFSINKWFECLIDNYYESMYLIYFNYQKWFMKNEWIRIIFKDY